MSFRGETLHIGWMLIWATVTSKQRMATDCSQDESEESHLLFIVATLVTFLDKFCIAVSSHHSLSTFLNTHT